MNLGWFVRGLHHVGSSAVVVLLVFHLVQGVLTKAYRAREVNWWLGLVLLVGTLAFSLTGYLCPGTRRATGRPRWRRTSRAPRRFSAPRSRKWSWAAGRTATRR